MEVERKAGTQDIVAQQTILLRPGDGHLESLDGQGILGAAIDVALPGADGIATDDHPFQQAVGIALDNGAIHKGPWVPFVRVAHDILGVPRSASGELPLESGDKAGPTPPAQPGKFDLFEHLLPCHRSQDLGQGLVTVPGDVFLNVLRVNQPAVSQGDAQLLAVERDVRIVRDWRPGLRVCIGQPLHYSPLDQRLLNQLGHIVGVHLAVKDALRVNGHHRSHGTEAAAAGVDHLDLVRQAAPG